MSCKRTCLVRKGIVALEGTVQTAAGPAKLNARSAAARDCFNRESLGHS